MNKDYYQILEIPRESAPEDIAKAYRKLALKHHPDRSALPATTAQHHFCLVSEAYEVLSCPKKRAFFDKYGEQTLKDGFFVDGEIQGGYCFNGDPYKIFEAFFGNNNAFAQIYDGQGDLGSMTGGACGGLSQKEKEPLQNKVVEVACTLNELYNGATKKVTYHREVLNTDGRTTSTKEETREIQVQRGCCSGDKITFHKLGHEGAGQQSSDLVFVLCEAPHNEYRRNGHDLVFTKDISLLQALTAQSVCLVTLDGREILVSLDEVVSPATCKVVKGEGLPKKDGSGKGDLLLHFNIHFPKQIKAEDKAQLKSLLE